MPTIIIAEAGVNHNGEIRLAKQLVDIASDAGADYVKFQTFTADTLVSKNAKKASYQIQNDKSADDSQYNMLKKLELTYDMHLELISYCKKKNIKFLSAPFDLQSIDLLNKLGLDLFKIPSGEIINLPYLRKIGSLGKKVILSTGMCIMQEIKDAVKVLLECGTIQDNIIVLHCNTEYPAPYQDVNLNAMNAIAKTLGVRVGYSDHTLGIEVPIAAVAMGACCIEKHFTLDRKLPGPDHKASLEPNELKQMVQSIRNIESALGDGIKKPSNSEKKNIIIARKSIHLLRDLKRGHTLTDGDLIMKRPGNGISPMQYDSVIGKNINKDLKNDHQLQWDDLI